MNTPSHGRQSWASRDSPFLDSIKTINVVLQKCVLGRSSFEGYNSDNRTNSIVWGGAEKKPNQWNIRHFGLLESEIIADHEETGVVTICWMSESEPRDGQPELETQWTRPKWFLHNYTLTGIRKNGADMREIGFWQPMYYFTAVCCSEFLSRLNTAVSSLRVKSCRSQSAEGESWASNEQRDWHICQIDKCVFSWKEVIICT